MSRLSELEQFLQDELQGGIHDSAGQFTMARQKALEKLGSFQLPRPTAWVLKVVQAAVAIGSPALFVSQTGTDTEFRFSPPSHWTLDCMEGAFYDPEVSPDRALDHLKRALWTLALQQLRPFRLVLTGCPEALVWSGQEFRRLPAQAPKYLLLTVSHRSFSQGKGLPGLRNLQAAQSNVEVLAELVQRAFVCPIDLWVDKRRLDALQGCPHHGFNPTTYPIRLGFARAQAPVFRVPPKTLSGYRPVSPGSSSLSGIFRSQTELPSQVEVAMLLSAKIVLASSGGSTRMSGVAQESYLNWVLGGVLVDRQELPIPPLAVSVALFASAEGLQTDLTGFQLTDNAERRERSAHLCRAVTPLVTEAKVSLESYVRDSQAGAYLLGGCLLLGGFFLSFASAGGVFLLGGGVVGGVLTKVAVELSAERALDREIQRQCESLQYYWRKEFPAESP